MKQLHSLQRLEFAVLIAIQSIPMRTVMLVSPPPPSSPIQVQCIVSALRTLAAWQAQQTHVQVQQQAAAAEPALSKPQPQPSSKVAPSELHRQLFEEREVTAQLQARIRQLQQELLLAGGPAVAATVPMPSSASVTPAPAKLTSAAARLARLSPGVGVHYSADAACVRVLQVAPTLNIAPTALEAAFAQVQEGRAAGAQDPAAAQDSPCGGAAAAAGEPAVGEQAEHGVLVQVGVTAAADSKAGEQLASHDQQQEQEQQEASAAAAAAAATIADQEAVVADLRAQLSELQERFHVTQRERSNFNSKLQSMRSVLAAARCSTPSSLLSSSGLASPQQSFGVLEPVFGVSHRVLGKVVKFEDIAWSKEAGRAAIVQLGYTGWLACSDTFLPPLCFLQPQNLAGLLAWMLPVTGWHDQTGLSFTT